MPTEEMMNRVDALYEATRDWFANVSLNLDGLERARMDLDAAITSLERERDEYKARAEKAEVEAKKLRDENMHLFRAYNDLLDEHNVRQPRPMEEKHAGSLNGDEGVPGASLRKAQGGF